MWVMLNDAWLSIVADRNDSELLLVRSRRRGDVNRVFGCPEQEDPKADYRFRAHIPRDQVAGVLAREAEQLAYDNFKSSVQDKELHDAYMSVWTVGFRLQRDELDKGLRRRGRPATILSSAADAWPPLNCVDCGLEIDHAFHAPMIGQPADLCESCWETACDTDPTDLDAEIETWLQSGEASELEAGSEIPGGGEQDPCEEGNQDPGAFVICNNCQCLREFCTCN